MTLPPGTPFVVFGDDWGRHVSTMQHLFRWIIPRYPVVWVNAIWHRKPTFRVADLRRAWEKGRAMLSGAAGPAARGDPSAPAPAAIVQPRVLPWHDRAPVYAWNVRSMVRAIRARLRALRLEAPPVLVTGSPPSAGVVGRLSERVAVYLCMDDFLHLPSVSADMIGPLERRLLDVVDAVVATAETLVRSKVPRSGRVHYLPQGVNYDHLAGPCPEPDDLHHLPRPRIGFAGGLYPRCDLALLGRVADAFPKGSVVLLGPVNVDLAPLAGRPNVHVLGPRPYAALPGYVQGFDVGIIPYAVNAETVAVDPLKLLEYLAAGLPVVTTAIPEARKYGDVVAIAGDGEDFVRQVAAALQADRADARVRGQALARQHTWERRAETLLAIIAEAAPHGRSAVA